VSAEPAFSVDPWSVRVDELRLDALAEAESVFALSNGHIGLRGNLDEGDPHVLPGTYLNGFHEIRPLPYAEGGYGFPEAGQTVVNVTNGKVIRLLVDDEPFDVRYGEILHHERVLDLRTGTLTRRTDWSSPAGTKVRVTSQRLVSFSQRAIAAFSYQVEALDNTAHVVVQSELVANEPVDVDAEDPRAAAALASPLIPEEHRSNGLSALLVHHTRASALRIGAGMDHVIEGDDGYAAQAVAAENDARVTVAADLKAGQRLRLVKFLAYGWSAQRTLPALRAQVEGALAEASHTGWEGLLAAQRDYLDDFWERADVELDGDAAVQQAIRFGLFHVLQAGARAERRAIPAKGLTGSGYDGHAFWDSETFVLPVLTYTAPEAVAPALHWRHDTIDKAKERAHQLGLEGASFPWRTIAGEECSGYWPAGTAAFHINADIADAVARYIAVTGDDEFEREAGLEILVETARLWRSLGHHDAEGRFRIDGVTGPDEYSALADNNVFTNLMAQRNLTAAADAAVRHRDEALALGVNLEEAAAWRDAASDILIPYDELREMHPQAEGFLEHALWDFDDTQADQYPLLLHFPYFDLYRRQVIKQADLVLALHLRGDHFTDEQKLRNFDYYERLTVRDSSLSACTQAVVAAEVGHLDLAYDYLGVAARMDLDNLAGNTRDGLHIASLAGAWIAAVAGFGGLRDHEGRLTFAPRLPSALPRMAFRVGFQRRLIKVEVRGRQAVYTLLRGEAIDLVHHGEEFSLLPDAPERKRIPPAPHREPPLHPAHRAPPRRGGRS
jgi:alpha,alpha-trehalose phosphorylase